jgi:hypothetical protein
MSDKINIVVSIPRDFKEKFLGFIKNLNMVNKNGELPITVEKIYIKKKFAAVPKKGRDE